jgi:hypothetical protein
MKMSLRKTMAKALTGIALASSLYGLPIKKARAGPIMINQALYFTPWHSSTSEVVFESKDPQTSSKNSNLYKQKKKQEFKPPELPYCRVVRADWEGVVIDYWDKRGKKHTYRWAVTQPHWYVGGATVDLVHEYPEQDNGDRDYEGLDECLIRAGKKVLEDSYAGGNGNLYIKKMTGYVFDHLTLYYNEE